MACMAAFSTPSVGAEGMSSESIVIQRYKEALKADPGDITTRYKLALTYLKEGRYAEAIEHFLAVNDSAQYKNDPDVDFYLGLAYTKAGDLEKAAESFKKLEDMGAQKAREQYELDKALYNLGIEYQKKGNVTEALRAYERAMEIAPDYGGTYCRKGELMFEMKDFAEALEDFKTCDEKSAGNGRVKRQIVATHLARGLALSNDKKYAEALLDFKKALDLDPKNENAMYFQGYLYYQMAEYKQALSALERVKSPESRDIIENIPSLLQNIAMELQSRDEWAVAEQALRRAVELKKKDPDLHYLLSVNYKKKGDLSAALDEAKETLRLNPEHQKAPLVLAIVTEKLIEQNLKKGDSQFVKGGFEAAIKDYGEVLSIDPLNQRALKGRQEAEARLEGIKHEVTRKRGEEITSRLLEGENAIKDERYREALMAFRYVLSLDPDNADAKVGAKVAEDFVRERVLSHALKGDQFSQEQNDYLALKEYAKALSYDPDDAAMHAKATAMEKRVAAKTAPLIEEAASHEEKEELKEAVKAYAEALIYDPENSEALNGKARAVASLDAKVRRLVAVAREVVKNGDYFQAGEQLKTAQKLKPDDPAVVTELYNVNEGLKKSIAQKLKTADKALKSERYAEALSIYSEVAAVDEKNAEALKGIDASKASMAEDVSRKMGEADDAYRDNRFMEAVNIYNEVLSIDKGNKNAKKMRDEARQRHDEEVASLLKKGEAAYNKGDGEEASAFFKKALSLDPGNAKAKRFLAMAERPRPRKADSKEIEKIYWQGVALYNDGKYLDAIKLWEKVLESDPRHEKAASNIEKTKRKLQGVMDVK